MVDIERREQILKRLEQYHTVKVAELSKDLYIGEATIRRDLTKLEKSGYLKRIYGGAVYQDQIDRELPADVRRYEHTEEKQVIASLAGALIQDSTTVSVDSSTTCLFLSDYLKQFQNLTVLTHGEKLTEALQYSGVNLYCSGGLMSKHTFSYGGEFTRRFFSSFHTDACFVSCKGISIDNGPSWAYDEEAALRLIMLKNTDKKILLCDSSKFGKTATSLLFGFEWFDCVITDKRPSKEWIQFFKERKIEVIYN